MFKLINYWDQVDPYWHMRRLVSRSALLLVGLALANWLVPMLGGALSLAIVGSGLILTEVNLVNARRLSLGALWAYLGLIMFFLSIISLAAPDPYLLILTIVIVSYSLWRLCLFYQPHSLAMLSLSLSWALLASSWLPLATSSLINFSLSLVACGSLGYAINLIIPTKSKLVVTRALTVACEHYLQYLQVPSQRSYAAIMFNLQLAKSAVWLERGEQQLISERFVVAFSNYFAQTHHVTQQPTGAEYHSCLGQVLALQQALWQTKHLTEFESDVPQFDLSWRELCLAWKQVCQSI
jgi:hypothetical protein